MPAGGRETKTEGGKGLCRRYEMSREDWLLGIKFLLSVIFTQRDELRVCQRKKSLRVVE